MKRARILFGNANFWSHYSDKENITSYYASGKFCMWQSVLVFVLFVFFVFLPLFDPRFRITLGMAAKSWKKWVGEKFNFFAGLVWQEMYIGHYETENFCVKLLALLFCWLNNGIGVK